jgi:hypothetical protein
MITRAHQAADRSTTQLILFPHNYATWRIVLQLNGRMKSTSGVEKWLFCSAVLAIHSSSGYCANSPRSCFLTIHDTHDRNSPCWSRETYYSSLQVESQGDVFDLCTIQTVILYILILLSSIQPIMLTKYSTHDQSRSALLWNRVYDADSLAIRPEHQIVRLSGLPRQISGVL